jgi:hypothetical protein
MTYKKLFYTALISLFFNSYATAYEKLTDYQMIKDKFLNGFNIKMVVDLKNDCTLLSDDTNGGPPTSPNVFGKLLTHFALKYKTGHIVSTQHILGSDVVYTGYNEIAELDLAPDNTINLALKIVTLPHYKIIKETHWACQMSNQKTDGIKFFVV